MDVDLLWKVMAALFLLLIGAFLVLALLKYLYPQLGAPEKRGLIEILDKKTDITIGTIAVVSIWGQRYVLLVTKSGAAIHLVDVKADPQAESHMHV